MTYEIDSSWITGPIQLGVEWKSLASTMHAITVAFLHMGPLATVPGH